MLTNYIASWLQYNWFRSIWSHHCNRYKQPKEYTNVLSLLGYLSVSHSLAIHNLHIIILIHCVSEFVPYFYLFCILIVYEVCKLGTHSPQHSGGQIEQSPGKYLPSGLVLVECPDQLKTRGSHSVSISSVTEYFQALSKSWSVKSFLSSLARIIKDIKLTLNISTNQKESSNIPCTVRPFTFSSFSTFLIQGTSKTIAACIVLWWYSAWVIFMYSSRYLLISDQYFFCLFFLWEPTQRSPLK